MRHIVDRLGSDDRAALIDFDSRVRTLVSSAPVGDRKALHAAIAGIHAGGTTNLCGGWQAGSAALLAGAAEAALARVILLSDGNANAGEITDTPTIAALCAQAAAVGVSTSTYGLGRDFNEELMVAMARQGQGNHYYGDTAADLFEPFAEEFDLISSLHSRQVSLSLGAPARVRIALLNDYPVETRDGFMSVRLPDIPWGAEAWALLELEIPAGLALESAHAILQAGVSGLTPEGASIVYPEASLLLGAVSAPAWDVLLADPLVAERQAELAAARLLDEARTAGEAGDWATIESLLATTHSRFGAFPWVAEVLAGMAEIARERDMARFRKEAFYSSRKMNSRLSAKDESAGLSCESAKPAFLRRKKSQGKAQSDEPSSGSDA